MTEKDAMKKWCPQMAVPMALACQQEMGEFVNTTCRGSDCMMWRWESRNEAWSRLDTARHGYCGLAGTADE